MGLLRGHAEKTYESWHPLQPDPELLGCNSAEGAQPNPLILILKSFVTIFAATRMSCPYMDTSGLPVLGSDWDILIETYQKLPPCVRNVVFVYLEDFTMQPGLPRIRCESLPILFYELTNHPHSPDASRHYPQPFRSYDGSGIY